MVARAVRNQPHAVQIAEEATGTDYAGPQAPTGGDIDGDGVPDEDDAYPRDATRS